MMRAWGNRPDSTVIDEPFYAAYLDRTGLDDRVHDCPLDRASIPRAGHDIVYEMAIFPFWYLRYSSTHIRMLRRHYNFHQLMLIGFTIDISSNGRLQSDLGP